MRGEQLKAYLNNKFLAVCPAYLDTLIETANSEEIARIETSNDISPAHSYEEKENVAIITIDGTTVKKNTFMNAISGGFVPYDALYGYRNKAENNPKITDVVWHIDTRGGDVEGVDRLGELIHTSKKNTHTFYSNKGASAGIWYGTASKKRYADETAMLGSIGVMAIMNMPSEGNNNQLVKVSKNAKNKNCMLDGSCAERVEKAINEKENVFYARVMRNTGFTEEKIKSVFNEGDMITAKQALDAGFIDEITTIDALIETLVIGTVPAKSKPVNSNFKEKSMAGNENPEQVDLVAAERERTKQIASLGMMYGVAAETVAEAIASGTDLSAFKDVCLEAQSNKFKATQEESAKKIEDLESRLNASIDAQATDGNATVEPTEPVQANKADEKNEKIIAAAEMTEV